MSIEELIQEAEQLAPDEQLQLVARLVGRIRQQYPTAKPRPWWSDIRGSAPYPLTGEDAQAGISRTRQEGDNHRDLTKEVA